MRKVLALYLPFVLAIVLVTVLTGASLSRSDTARLKTIANDQITLGSHVVGDFLAAPVGQIAGMLREPEFNQAYRLPLDEAKTALQKHFLTLLYRNRTYHQARWLSKEGDELVRVYNGAAIPLAIPREELVNKSHLDWFKDAIAQPPDRVYVLTMDLGRNNANVVDPAQPVVRLGVRLPTEEAQDAGLLIVNVALHDLFRHLVDITAGLNEELMLLNPRGHWLLAPDPKDAFGFALGSPENSFARRQPAEWARISEQPAGQMMTSSGLWTWSTIDPAAVLGGEIAAAETWKLVAHMPAATIVAITWKRWWPLLLLAGTSLVMTLFGIHQYRKLWMQREVAASERVLAAEKAAAEQRLRLATVGADVGVWYWDRAGDSLGWSAECQKHLAVPPGTQPTFDRFYAAIHPEDRGRVRATIEEAAEKRQDYYAEYRTVNPDGSVRWVAAPGKVHTTPDGNLAGMSGLTIDVTRLKTSEASLRDLAASLERRVEERTAELARSRERLAAVLDSLLDVHVLLQAVRDKDGTIIDLVHAEANAAACLYNKCERAQLIGRSLLEILPGTKSNGLFDMYCKVIETGAPLFIDDFCYERELQGEPRWFDMRGVKVEDMISLAVRDVTDRHKAAQNLAESQRSFRLLAENASDVVFKTDVAGIVTYVSPSSTHSLGCAPERMVGMPFRNLVHPDEWDAIESLEDQVRRGTPANAEARLRIGEGGYQWFSLSLKPLLDANAVVSSCVGGLRDIQREVQTREAVKAERQRWKATIDGMLEPVVLVQPVRDKDGHVTDFLYAEANPAACAWLRMEREDLLGRRMLELFPAVETTGLMQLYRDTAETGRQAVIDNFPFPVGEGTRWLDVRGVRVDERVSLVWRDETERHHQQEVITNERKHLADVIEGSDTGTWEWHVPTGAVVVNEVVAKLLGYRLEEIRPTNIGMLEKLTHPDDLAHARSLLERCFRRESEVYECEARMRHRNGEWVWIHTRGRVVEWTGDGKPLRMLGTHRDITASVKARQELEHRATTDALTGLCNRREFMTVAHRELSRAGREGTPLSLLVMDIDKFKSINDTHGHDVGDAVLKTIGGICAPHLRERDVLARIGGEEFAVLLPDTSLDGATQVAERIREAIGRESVPAGDGTTISFTVSVGVAEWDGESAELQALAKRSDEALYRAKKTGGNRVCTGGATPAQRRQHVAAASPPTMS